MKSLYQWHHKISIAIAILALCAQFHHLMKSLSCSTKKCFALNIFWVVVFFLPAEKYGTQLECAKCHLPLNDSQFVECFGKFFHLGCLECEYPECRKVLIDGQYFTRPNEQKVYCSLHSAIHSPNLMTTSVEDLTIGGKPLKVVKVMLPDFPGVKSCMLGYAEGDTIGNLQSKIAKKIKITDEEMKTFAFFVRVKAKGMIN